MISTQRAIFKGEKLAKSESNLTFNISSVEYKMSDRFQVDAEFEKRTKVSA